MSSEHRSAPRVLLIGLGPTAATALEALHERFEVLAVVRSGNDEVVELANDLGVDVCSDVTIDAVAELIRLIRPDCVIVSSYDRILPASLMASCPFVNVHYAPLPRYRGRATVNWAIINGETEAVITVHNLSADLDAGGILHQHRVPIGPRDTVTEVYARLNAVQRSVLATAVARRLSGDQGEPQDELTATHTCTRTPDDGEIDWKTSTAQIDRLVRALADPFPGAYTFLGTEQLWIRRADPVLDAPVYEGRVPGRVVRVTAAEGAADVLTGDGLLRIFEVQRKGTPPAPASDIVRSVRQTLGVRTVDVVRRMVGLERELAIARGESKS